MSSTYKVIDSSITPINLGLVQGSRLIQGGIGTNDRNLFAFDLAGTAGKSDQIQLSFDHNSGAGDLDLYLYQVGNSQPIRQSTTAKNTEFIDLSGLGAGSYIVEVSGYRNSSGNYSLSLTTPQVTYSADASEAVGNNSFTTAETLDVTKTRFNRSIDTADDQDYYKFDLRTPGLASNFFSIQFEETQGNLELSLYDANKNLIKLPAQQSTGVAGNVQISLAGLPAGVYYAKVNGINGAKNNYTLTLDLPRPTPDAWTVMTYITASDLEQFAPKNLEQMEVMTSKVPNSVNFSALWDQSSAKSVVKNGKSRLLLRYPTPGEAAWGDTGQAFLRPDLQGRKAYLELGQDPATDPQKIRIASPFERIGEQKTGNATALENYLAWATQNAPATRNALVMWNHGGGPFGFNFDDADGEPESNMTTKKLVTALESARSRGTNIDLLAFDECLMASVEVAYELRKVTPLLVASEEVIPGDGYNYQNAFSALQNSPETVSPTDLASSLVESYNDKYKNDENGQNTLSVTRTDKLNQLAADIRQFTTATEQATEQDWQLMRAAQKTIQPYSDSLFDLGKFAINLRRQSGLSDPIRFAAREIKRALNQTVIAQTEASKAKTTGLSIFLPTTQQSYEDQMNDYAQQHAEFFKATGWVRFLKQFSDHALAGDSDSDITVRRQSNSEQIINNDQSGKAASIEEGISYNNLKLARGTSSWFTFETSRTTETEQGRVTVKLGRPNRPVIVKLYASEGGNLLVTKRGRGTVQIKYANTSATPYWVEVTQRKFRNSNYQLIAEPLGSQANTPTPRSRNLLTNNQSKPSLELTPFGTQQVTTATTKSNRNNSEKYTLGLYKVEDNHGGVRDLVTGKILYPSDAGYAEAAMQSNKGLQLALNSSEYEDFASLRDVQFAPFVATDGTQAITNLTTYFAYQGANSDRKTHLQALGNQVWGFEANPGGQDVNFNDIVFRVNPGKS